MGFSKCRSRLGKEEFLRSQFSLVLNSIHVSHGEGDRGLASVDDERGCWRGSDGGGPGPSPRRGQGIVGKRRTTTEGA